MKSEEYYVSFLAKYWLQKQKQEKMHQLAESVFWNKLEGDVLLMKDKWFQKSTYLRKIHVVNIFKKILTVSCKTNFFYFISSLRISNVGFDHSHLSPSTLPGSNSPSLDTKLVPFLWKYFSGVGEMGQE